MIRSTSGCVAGLGILAGLALMTCTAVAQAAPGDLVPAFSGDGKLTTDFLGSGFDRARALALQPNGKLVAAGESVGGGGPDFSLARYNADGSLDAGFSEDGKQVTRFDGPQDVSAITDVVMQADGKIVAAGGSSDPFSAGDFALARYHPDGSLDDSFAGDGRVTTDVGGTFFSPTEARGVLLQPDGKIVAAGTSALVRYNADGSLDQGFAEDGVETLSLRAHAVARQSDGKLIVAGVSDSTSDGDFAVARYDPDGSLDTSFSGDGQVTTDLGGAGDTANALAVQPDGKLVAAGTRSFGSFALVRYNADGSLDTGFSDDGKEVTSFGTEARDIALQPDGKLVVTGTAVTIRPDVALARYHPNGSLDLSFSDDGKLTTDLGGDDDGESLVLEPDGQVVAAGFTGPPDPSQAHRIDYALVRYNPDGSLDSSFTGDGSATTDFDVRQSEVAAAVAVQPDDRIVAAGSTSATQGDFALARYQADGSLDTSFTGDGQLTTDFGWHEEADDVALQGDGKIVAAGRAFDANFSNPDFALARYSSDGSLDPSFAGDGKQTTDLGGHDQGMSLALQPNGKMVVAGVTSSGSNFDFALARYQPDGTLDASFSGDGMLTTDFGVPSIAYGVIAQPDGKIVAVGSAQVFPNRTTFALARYNPDGSLDTSFSGDGLLTDDFGAAAHAVILQPDGKLVVVGTSGAFVLARYNADGSRDTTFSGDGTQTTVFGPSVEGAATDVSLEPNGRILAVGLAGGNFALARYNPSGTLDASFSDDGRQTTDFGGELDGARGVALLDGDFVAVGSDDSGEGDFALARYEGGGPPPDTTSPETLITEGPTAITYPAPPIASFAFASNEPGSSFECRLDDQPFLGCQSPYTTSALADGAHTFEVRAIDPAGNIDPSPAAHTFTVDSSARPPAGGGPAQGTQTGAPPPSSGGGPPTRIAIAAALEADVTAAARTLRRLGIARLVRRRGFTVRGLHALLAGAVSGTLTATPDGAAPARRVLIGRGSHSIPRAGRYDLTLRLTRAGVRLLRRHPPARITLAMKFRYAAGQAVTKRRTVALRR